jgi:ribosomal protein S18 acetylase RimI-like enzyme
MTAAAARGRGVARQMCAHSLEYARSSGYRAMQFNFVVSTNAGAVRLWRALGFEIVGRLPQAFRHPRLGFVDAFVMHQALVGSSEDLPHAPQPPPSAQKTAT